MFKKNYSHSYGIILCALIGASARILSNFIPIGSVTIAIIIGAIAGNLMKNKERFHLGIIFSEKRILSFAIALMGVNLNFLILKDLGFKSIVLIITAMAVTIGMAIVLSKIFHLENRFALLLGIGNGVCGSSAIAATEKIIGAKEEETGLSIAIVNFLGTIGIFILPLLSRSLFNLSSLNSGIFIGNTLQAVGQVIAAGFSISETVGQTATIIKMARILMLFPLLIILIFSFSNNKTLETNEKRIQYPKIPLFIIGFIIFSIIPTLGLLNSTTIDSIDLIGDFALLIAMSGIGLKISLKSILSNGRKALVVGSLIFLTQITFNASILYLLF